MYDTDKDGSISIEEFKECMSKLEIPISDEAAKNYI